MTTIADALKGVLDAQWAVPTGGTEPTWYVSDDTSVPPPNGIDYVLIQSYTLTTRIDAVNNTYSNKTHRIDMEVNTPTGDDRLKQLADEVERILNTVAITGVNWQKVTHRENISDKRIPFYRERITCSLLEMLASSTSAYGANTTASALNSLLMYGSANAAWIPCSFIRENQSLLKLAYVTGYLANLDATDLWVGFALHLPTNRGGLKLYIKGLRILVYDADADDYIDQVQIIGVTETGTTPFTVADGGTNRTAQGDYTYTVTLTDASVYDYVGVNVVTFNTNAQDLDFGLPLLQVYYDT